MMAMYAMFCFRIAVLFLQANDGKIPTCPLTRVLHVFVVITKIVYFHVFALVICMETKFHHTLTSEEGP